MWVGSIHIDNAQVIDFWIFVVIPRVGNLLAVRRDNRILALAIVDFSCRIGVLRQYPANLCCQITNSQIARVPIDIGQVSAVGMSWRGSERQDGGLIR